MNRPQRLIVKSLGMVMATVLSVMSVHGQEFRGLIVGQ